MTKHVFTPFTSKKNFCLRNFLLEKYFISKAEKIVDRNQKNATPHAQLAIDVAVFVSKLVSKKPEM